MAEGLQIRDAVEADAPLILEFIRELAVYEKMADEVVATEADIVRHMFGPDPRAHAVIAESDGAPIGFALYFRIFSTFAGKPGLYLEDLFVRPDHRGRGAGKALMVHLAAKALKEGCGYMKWAVLDWNAPSIAFYEALGATPVTEWISYRLDEAGLTSMAENQ